MSRFLIILITALSSMQMALAEEVELVKMQVRKAYVPVGFDSNDQAEIYVAGYLPDGCHRIGPHLVTVDDATKTVMVEQQAYKHPGPCPDMIIPFAHVVRIGMMNRGDYRIVDAISGKQLGTLPVVEATKKEVDDFLYLPLTNAYAKQDAVTHEASLVLEGKYSDRCTRYKETHINYFKDVIVVQPIVERLESRNNCTGEPTRFQIVVPLKAGLKGDFLIHVRGMSGEAVNSLFSFGS